MSNPNTDRDGRVARIRKLNQMRRDNGSTALAPEILDDIDYLLSLLDTQAAEVIALRKEVAASERYQALLLDQPDATRMRDRCLEKVGELRDKWLNDPKTRYGSASSFAEWLLDQLQSLTLEGERE